MARRERNIYKRKDGRYEARFISGRDRLGKAKYKAVYARSYGEVKKKLKLAREACETAQGCEKTVTEAAEAYIAAIKNQVKRSTRDCYRRYADNRIKPGFPKLRCNQLSSEILQGFVDGQLESGLSAATVRSVFGFLKKCLQEAGCAPGLFDVRLPKLAGRAAEVFALSEQKRLEAAAIASDCINRTGVLLCLYTGLRLGELCGLMWDDLDLARGTLHVRRTAQRVRSESAGAKTELVLMPPKSRSSARSIPLPGFLLELLRGHKAAADGDFVVSKNGKAVEPRAMQFRFKRLLRAARLRPANFHIMRHTFSARALENGFDIKTLGDILGHSSPVVTLTKYAHALDRHKRRSMESLLAVYELDENGQDSGSAKFDTD